MIRVLVVDDSAIVRDVLSQGLGSCEDIEVVGTAPDPYIARNKILSENPDVVTLDIEMPRMDGLSFLKIIMTYKPLPVIIISSVSTNDRGAALEALSLGAFDVVNKPSGNLSVQGVLDEVVEKVRAAYEHRDRFRQRQLAVKAMSKTPRPHVDKMVALAKIRTSDSCIAIGSSTGGTIALEYILPRLPANLPPVVIVQHMPSSFTGQFAQRLDGLSTIRISEAQDGELLQQGNVYIAPGGMHMEVERQGTSVYIALKDGAKVQFQKPSVDVLFHSMAQTFGKNCLGILLTGMGRDGADGMLAMKRQGAETLVQNEESSVVWGMPRAAFEIGAHTAVVDLAEVPSKISAYGQNVLSGDGILNT